MTTGEAAKKPTTERRGAVLDVLRELLGEGRSAEALGVVAKLVARNEELELLLAKLRAKKNRAEGVSTSQLDLFLDVLRKLAKGDLAAANETLETTAEEQGGRPDEVKPPKQPPVRRPPPAGLRREENRLQVPPEQRACPVCGNQRVCVSHETTEVIDLKPAEVFVRLDIREVIACQTCEAEMERAPMGDKVVHGGAYGSALVADLVVGKYRDALPLHRQGEILERLGLSMPSSSMSDQIQWATDLLRPLWRYLQGAVLGAVVMHVDGTSLPVRDKDTAHAVAMGALWGFVGRCDDGASCAAYLYTSTAKKTGQRPGEIGPEDFLRAREGPIVADASNLFDVTFSDPKRIEIGCNMHARRYFVKALEANDVRAAVVIKAFQALYDVEDATKAATNDERRAERQRRAKPVYDELVTWCRTHQPYEPPSSLLGAAIRYTLNHRIALSRYLDDGALPIDNGVVERLHRRPAVGRRNYLFAGSHAGGDRAAIAYSVLASCDLADVNPIEYLSDVLPRLARDGVTLSDIRRLAPAHWKQARSRPTA